MLVAANTPNLNGGGFREAQLGACGLGKLGFALIGANSCFSFADSP